jgi:methylenetetrahydrofolate reductase (NADPH)
MQLIAMVKKMRDEGKFLNGEDIDGPPKLFIGAASNPFGDPFEYRVFRLAKKIQAGVDFVQTQCIFNMEKFREFMKQAVDMGLHEKCYILAGVTPMKSAGMANFMSKFVPGMDIPESLIKRLRGVPKKDQPEEGIKFALEQIEEFKEMEGVAGVHLMAIEWEHRVPEIAERANVLPRPVV